MERVRKSALQIIQGVDSLSYAERIKDFSLLMLWKRRSRGALITVCKYTQGKNISNFREIVN